MGNISILLADDSITIQKVVGIIFAGDGYTLTVVDSGAAAVQKAQEMLPDVLLIDVVMPGMNGYEVCEQLRAIPALAAKPVLLLSGSFEAFDEAKAKSCGADDHITKPFESHQIIAKVQELYAVGQRRASGEQAPPVVDDIPAAVEPASFIEPTAFASTSPSVAADEPFGFEPTALETTPAFESSSAAVETAQPEISPDDPWGAFTQPATQQEESQEEVAPEATGMDIELEHDEPQPLVVPEADDVSIGTSWVPVEEQTFEFQEEVAEPPATIFEQEPPVVVEEPAMPAVMPVTAAAVTAAPVALTEEQLKNALMSVSKETIERIVWEVVPDLAESLIKETIRRITEGK